MTSSEFDITPFNRLILAYAPRRIRPLFEAVFGLDQQLGKIIRATSEPMLGQMRLRWWHDVIIQPPDARPIGNPVLAKLSALDGEGLASQSLAPMVDGWEMLLGEQDLTPEMIDEYAQRRGATMFGFIAAQSQKCDPLEIEKLGAIYAIWDLARQ
jgi:phytoene synthase